MPSGRPRCRFPRKPHEGKPQEGVPNAIHHEASHPLELNLPAGPFAGHLQEDVEGKIGRRRAERLSLTSHGLEELVEGSGIYTRILPVPALSTGSGLRLRILHRHPPALSA